jgi:hypothetical protein
LPGADATGCRVYGAVEGLASGSSEAMGIGPMLGSAQGSIDAIGSIEAPGTAEPVGSIDARGIIDAVGEPDAPGSMDAIGSIDAIGVQLGDTTAIDAAGDIAGCDASGL